MYDDVAPDARIDGPDDAALTAEAELHGLRVLAHLSLTGMPASRLIDLGVDAFIHAAVGLDGALPLFR